MPTVFLSYSRTDLPLIEQLEAQLKSHPEISIWRDQEKIYGGQKWPKILGEAIADQDVFLLAWSKNAAASHFVEFEWRTALALKKMIVPCLLDGELVPDAFKNRQVHDVDDIYGIVKALRTALPAMAERRGLVIHRLSAIAATEPRAVLDETKIRFADPQRAKQGTVIQARNDIHIHTTPILPRTGKPLIERWETWASLVAALATIGTALYGYLPGTMSESHSPIPIEQQLGGTVLDETTGEPLPGVVVSLPDFDMKRTTEADGSFRFRVTSQKQARVNFTAQKHGYKSYSHSANLGNTELRFPMEKSE